MRQAASSLAHLPPHAVVEQQEYCTAYHHQWDSTGQGDSYGERLIGWIAEFAEGDQRMPSLQKFEHQTVIRAGRVKQHRDQNHSEEKGGQRPTDGAESTAAPP